VRSFKALRRDLALGSLPRFTWIAPNVWHDGHSGTLRAVDRFAARTVPQVVRALGPHGVLLVTWDEGRRSDHSGAHGAGGGHVPLIALGPMARPGARLSLPANHYSLLKTIEMAFHVPLMGHARAASTPVLSGLLRP
jgi:hypothetical protein